MFRNVLQPDRQGLIVVFHSPCNPTFSYQVDGGKVTYIGQGDQHDAKFDYLEASTSLFENPVFQTFNKTYSGVPLKDDFCPYTLKIYPSQVTQDFYRTNKPITLTLVSALLWAFSSSIFLVYDVLVQRRQRRSDRKAKKSDAIVTSLFPSNVHQRLFAEGESDMMVLEAPSKKRLRSFLSTGNAEEDEQANDEDNAFVIYKRKPIADFFSDVTIMFADLCSFTAWSSTRQPSDVFMVRFC